MSCIKTLILTLCVFLYITLTNSWYNNYKGYRILWSSIYLRLARKSAPGFLSLNINVKSEKMLVSDEIMLYCILTPALPPDILAFIIPYMFSPEFVESTMIKCTFISLSKKNTFTMSNYYELSTQSVLTTSNDETSFQDFIVILKITTKRFWRNISSVLHTYWYIVHV